MCLSVEKWRKKWKYLRDTFKREKNEEKERKKSGSGTAAGSRRWKYTSILSFLEPYITNRDTSSNLNTSDEDISVVALLESMVTPVETSDESTQSLTQSNTTQSGSPDSPNVPPLCTPEIARRTLAPKRRAEQDITEYQRCVLNAISDNKPDEEEHFLLSLVVALRRLPPRSRSEVKLKFQQILHDAEFNNQ
ncbi:unnamed protein product [Leuciscus chuanchicus]